MWDCQRGLVGVLECQTEPSRRIGLVYLGLITLRVVKVKMEGNWGTGKILLGIIDFNILLLLFILGDAAWNYCCSSTNTTNPSYCFIWAMKMEHYLSHTYYPIWQVIYNGNGPVSVITDTNGIIKVLPPKTAEEVVARERERKARTTLLMALPKDHLAKFHKMDDAKEIQLEIHGVGVSHEDANQKFLRSLPSSWSQVALIMRTKPGLDTFSFDDLYNNQRVFKRDVKGHFARECRAKGNQESRRRDVGYNGNKTKDNGRRPTYKDDSKALVTINGEDIDWSEHVEKDAQNYAMMAYSSSNSGSDKEVKSCSKACEESYARLKKLYDDQRDKLGDASVEITAYTLALKKSVFMNKASDLEDTPVNDRFTDGMHAVPPPMTGNYIPSGPNVEIDYSKFTYGPKQTSLENASKVVCEPKVWTDAPIIKEYESDSDNDLVSNNKVLFTDIDCLVLSPDFKLPNENQVLLKIPRQHNMYSFNLKNIDPSGDLACLFVKASIDESNKWHRRLGHVNFKNLNKLVKENLVRGLPFKIFENNHKCVSCQKGKKHKASCKVKTGSRGSIVMPELHNKNGVAERKNKTLIEAVRTMILVTKPQNKIPYELLTGKKPMISYLRPFGYHVTILNIIDQLGKFDEKSDSGFLVGYSLNKKALRVYNLETKRVGENLHVNFLENKPNVTRNGHAWMFDLDYLTTSMNYEPVLIENQANKSAGSKKANNNVGTQANDDQGDNIEKNTSFKTCEKPNASTSNTNLINTASIPLSTIGPLRAFNDGELSYANPSKYALLDDPSMHHLEDIYASPSEGIFTDSSYDDEAVQTRSKVNKNSEAHALEKKDERGVVVRNKARLVAQGHRQKEGIDYDEVFALVTRIKAIRIFLAFSFYMGFIVYQMDVKSAFLYGTIDEEVYVSQPLSFVDPKFPNKVYKVVKALYGLHQAPRAWFYKEVLKEDGIFIGQDKYVAEILKKFDFLSVKTASTPIETQKPLVKDEEVADVDVHLYRFQVTPKTLHLHVVKRIFRYLKGQPKLGLWYPKVSSFDLESYSDNDYAGANLDRKSTTRCSNAKNFDGLAKMGYEKLSEKLTFYKAFFSPEWKFLIYTILQCLIKNIEVGVPFFMFPRFVQLLIDHQLGDMSHHKDIYNNPILTKKVFANMKRVGTGFSGVVTLLFDNMLVLATKEVGLIQDDVQSISIPTELSTSKPHKKHKPKKQQTQAPKVPSPEPSPEHKLPLPSNDPLPGGKDSLKIRELMDLCTHLSNKVLELESEVIEIKSTYRERIEKLEGRVDRLEEENKVSKELYSVYSKVDIVAPIVEKEKSFKRERIIADINEDVSVLRRRRGVVIQDPEETTSTIVVHLEVQSKDKGKVMKYQALKRKPVTEAQAKKNKIIYLKNMPGYKMNYFKRMTYSEIRPLFEKHYNYNQAFLEEVNEEVTVPEKEVEVEDHKREGESLKKEITKKQKIDKDAEELKSYL
nr:putative ribonuclease H-like domain-containing protein [Tanacetum cinerariifolium]